MNGTCEVRDGLLSYSTYDEGHYVYGDFNHDGLKDAAVIISEGEGASQVVRSLAFLINDGQHLVHQPVRFASYIWKRIDGFILDSLKRDILPLSATLDG